MITSSVADGLEFVPQVVGDQVVPQLPVRVLLVDDDPLGLKFVTVKLRHAGYVVTPAASAREALDLLASDAFDVVVSDIRMPRMDGFQFCGTLREDERYAALPFLLLSSAVDESDLQRGEALGVPCIVRTADVRELFDALASALANRSFAP